MPADYELDDLDRKILALLMENAKRPYTELGQKLFVSGGTIHVRMNKLIAAGIVKGADATDRPHPVGVRRIGIPGHLPKGKRAL